MGGKGERGEAVAFKFDKSIIMVTDLRNGTINDSIIESLYMYTGDVTMVPVKAIFNFYPKRSEDTF